MAASLFRTPVATTQQNIILKTAYKWTLKMPVRFPSRIIKYVFFE